MKINRNCLNFLSCIIILYLGLQIHKPKKYQRKHQRKYKLRFLGSKTLMKKRSLWLRRKYKSKKMISLAISLSLSRVSFSNSQPFKLSPISHSSMPLLLKINSRTIHCLIYLTHFSQNLNNYRYLTFLHLPKIKKLLRIVVGVLTSRTILFTWVMKATLKKYLNLSSNN